MQSFKPRDYQQLMVNYMLEHPRCAVWAQMGLGKTASVLMALDALSLVEDIYPALVLAPLRVAQSTWPDEVAKWKEFKHLRLSPVIGDKAARLAALNQSADIYTINYENLPWLIEHYGAAWPFKTVVVDEHTRLKSYRSRQGGARARSLATVAHTKVTRLIGLTGTPSPKGLVDLWGQIWFIDQGVRLGRSFSAFEQRWFRKTYDGWGLEPLPTAQEEISDRLQDICVSLSAADYFPLEAPIVTDVYVDLPPAARKLYRDMERDLFLEIEQQEVEAFNQASKTMKCLQLGNGSIYLGEGSEKWKEVHDVKIQALQSIIEEASGAPVLVAYHFKSDLARLQKAFPKGRVLDKKPQTLTDWNAGKIPVLFAHPASAGHGLNLQDGGNIIVFFSLNWNLEEHQQIIERIGPVRQLQAGHRRPVFIYRILARHTLDDQVLLRLATKRDVQDILREAVKHKGERL